MANSSNHFMVKVNDVLLPVQFQNIFDAIQWVVEGFSEEFVHELHFGFRFAFKKVAV